MRVGASASKKGAQSWNDPGEKSEEVQNAWPVVLCQPAAEVGLLPDRLAQCSHLGRCSVRSGRHSKR